MATVPLAPDMCPVDGQHHQKFGIHALPDLSPDVAIDHKVLFFFDRTQ